MQRTILYALALAWVITSCGGKTESGSNQDAQTVEQNPSPSAPNASKSTTQIIDTYLAVKDALVADDQALAAEKSKALAQALKSYDISGATANDPEELERLQVEATSFAENLASGDLAAQRESFQALSVVVKDMLKIAGTDRTIYHQYCPMYKNNTGGMWLSAEEEIKNPLFGSKMLSCGTVEETLASN